MLNPLHLSTKESIVNLSSQLEGLDIRSKRLAKDLQSAVLRIAELGSEIDIIQRETLRRERELSGANEELLSSFREEYLAELIRVEQLTTAEIKKREEINSQMDMSEAITKEVNLLEMDISDYKLQIDVLTRVVAKTEKVRIALAAKAEEAALHTVSKESAAATGTEILFRAEVNPLKISPARSKIVLVAILGTFICCGLVIFAMEKIRTREETSVIRTDS